MTKKEILYEIFEGPEGYIKNPKQVAINDMGRCFYKQDETGNMCAVGRCLLPEEQLINSIGKGRPYEYLNNIGNIEEVNCQLPMFKKLETIDDILQEKYRGHCLDFWVNVQDIHDNGFKEGELSEQWALELEAIKNLWSND